MTATLHVTDGDDRVRRIRWSYPARRNALTRELLLELATALQVGPPDAPTSCRAVVLFGDPRGRAFSSGFDLQAIDEAERAGGLDPIDEPARAIETCPVPVLAALDGPTVGGAVELAAACDLRIASAGSFLCLPPARLGLAYSPSGISRLLRRASASTAIRMLVTGQRIPAAEALRLGLLDHVAAQGTALHVALDWAREIAAGAPLAVRAMIRSVRALSDGQDRTESLREALNEDRLRTVRSEDLTEGLQAVRARRSPAFRGL